MAKKRSIMIAATLLWPYACLYNIGICSCGLRHKRIFCIRRNMSCQFCTLFLVFCCSVHCTLNTLHGSDWSCTCESSTKQAIHYSSHWGYVGLWEQHMAAIVLPRIHNGFNTTIFATLWCLNHTGKPEAINNLTKNKIICSYKLGSFL